MNTVQIKDLEKIRPVAVDQATLLANNLTGVTILSVTMWGLNSFTVIGDFT